MTVAANLAQFAELPDDPSYETITDLAQLRVALLELGRFWHCLGPFVDVAAESPGTSLTTLRTVKEVNAAILAQFVERIKARQRILEAARQPAVVVVDPMRCRMATAGGTTDTIGLLPVVSRPGVPTSGLSSAIVRLAAQTASPPQVSPDHDQIVAMISGSAGIAWVDQDGTSHREIVRTHQHALLAAGTQYQMINDGHTSAVGLVVRATADATAGVVQLGELVDIHGAVCTEVAS